jgi:high frequency lysogenization protein
MHAMSMHTHDPVYARAVACAALVQAAHLVQCVARKGTCDREEFHTMIASLTCKTQPDPAACYGGINKLHSGTMNAIHILQGKQVEHAKPVLTYVGGLMALEKKLARQPAMLKTLGEGLERIEKQSEYFGSVTHENVVASIASLYGETVSTLNPRIIVRGKPEHLRQSSNTNRVRSLLLSGIRAAHLWRSNGGSHIRFLFGRRQLIRQLQALQDQIGRD